MEMKKIYSGKTKDIYERQNGNLFLCFKDDVTGEDGVVDPGANTVMGQLSGKGRMALELTEYFFNILHREKIPTHLVAVHLDRNAMEVRKADMPGQKTGVAAGLEFICRQRACGSFLKRYRKCVKEEMQPLDRLVEITLKDDEQGDPLINDDTLVTLGVLNPAQLKNAKELTRRITGIIEADLQQKGLSLVDMKVEFGLIDDKVVLIDEVSGDSMRVMDENGRILSHRELYDRLIKT